MNTTITLKEIEKLIAIQKNTYKDTSRIISDYNRERATTTDYNGRELLELLQNADDEKSTEVLIKLDAKNKILKIANRGENCTAFSIDGINSLMLANISPKTSHEFIGNKGLGFRSIVKWSDTITINSNNVDIIFSKQIAYNAYDKIYDKLVDGDKQKIKVKTLNLANGVKPIAILAIPEYKENQPSNWTTSISINYQENYLDDIEKQLENLKPEILLFLNSIRTITVDNNDDIKKIEKPDQWNIEKKEGEIPKDSLSENDKNTKYELKIAWNDELTNNDNKCLYSYFPTKVEIAMPFIVHGTFDLDSARNHLNSTHKNKFVLEKLVDFIIEVAKKLTKNGASYKALEFLNYDHEDTRLDELGFYEKMNEAIEELEIYPCIDGKYRKKADIVFSDDFARFIKSSGFCDFFPHLLMPADNDTTVLLNKFDLNGFSCVNKESLEKLSREIKNTDDRVALIDLLVKNQFDGKLSLLVCDKDEIIEVDNEEAYMPFKESFSLPDFVSIRFVKETLVNSLAAKFDVAPNKLPEKLETITSIYSYERSKVLQKIVTETNKELKKDSVDLTGTIQEMVSSLYENYQKLDDPPKIDKVQLLNKNHKLNNAKDLYLSKDYPSGVLTEELFGDIFTDNEFLSDAQSFGFPDDKDSEQIENFFLWLGVNKHTKFYDAKQDEENYIEFVFKEIGKPTNYRNSDVQIEGISNFKGIRDKLSREKIVLWFYLDKDIYKKLDDSNNDIFKYQKTGDRYDDRSRLIDKKPSYISYQMRSTNIFNDHLIGKDKLSPLINKTLFNFKDAIFEKYEVNKSDIESILLKIGAVNKFENLSIDAVNRIVQELPEKSKDGKQTQSIYELCIKHFVQNKQPLSAHLVRLFATKNDEKTYFPAHEIFYDNMKLPKKITNTKAILNYPRRQNAKNVTEFFGIQELKSLTVEVIKKDESYSITEEFKTVLEEIKPYILSYRIKGIGSDNAEKDELKKLRSINIHLCTRVQCKIDDELSDLEDNDYVIDGKNYLIQVNKHNSLNNLLSEFEFQESFADIIGRVFDIQETKVFRDMMKEDDEYIEKTIRNDIGNDILIRAKELLDIPDEYNSFWKTIYKLKDKIFSPDKTFDIKNDLQLNTEIKNIDFSSLETHKSCSCIKQLFIELKINIKDFNDCESAYYKICFKNFHKIEIKHAFENKLLSFKKCLYTWCIENNQQEKFIKNIEIYEYNDEFISKKANQYKNEIEIDYVKIVEGFIKEKFDIANVNETSVDFDGVHKENIGKIDNLNGEIEYLSLLYFENTIDEIKEHIRNKNETVDANNESKKDNPPKPIKDVTLSMPEQPKQSGTNSKNSIKHNPKDDERKRIAGKKAEQDVYDRLKADCKENNIHWVSQYDDNLGFDIKYRNEQKEWKYVEVKTLSKNKFYLTKKEKEFADSHKEHYELFLVGSVIYRVTDIDFSDKNKFRLVVNTFEVSYTVNEL